MSGSSGMLYGTHQGGPTDTRWLIRNGSSSSPIWYAPLANPPALETAIAYKTNDSALSYDGNTVKTNNTVPIPSSVTQLHIFPNGTISKLTYWPVRLADEYLVSLTT